MTHIHSQEANQQHLAPSPDRGGVLTCWNHTGTLVESSAVPAVLLICEHASNQIVPPWQALAQDAELLDAHVASDRGALGLAQALGSRLARVCGGAELVHAPLSRLIYDLNRSPDRPDACPEHSEIYPIAMNQEVSATDRLARTEALYLPFHNLVRARIVRGLALGGWPVVLTIHSFTPIWHGTPRKVEFGVIHDALPALSQAIADEARAQALGLVTELNAPYSAVDHVTHSLRLHALPYGLPNAMLELRNDLIANPQSQQDMADRLAPVLERAIARVAGVSCLAS